MEDCAIMMAAVSGSQQLFNTAVESLRSIANQLDGMKNYNLSCVVWTAIAIATRKIEDIERALESAHHASTRSHKADVLVVLVRLFAEKGETNEAFAAAADLVGLSTSRHAQARIFLASIVRGDDEHHAAQEEISDIKVGFLREEAGKDLELASGKLPRHTGLFGDRYSGQLNALKSYLERIMAFHRPGGSPSQLSLSLYLGAEAICLLLMSEILAK